MICTRGLTRLNGEEWKKNAIIPVRIESNIAHNTLYNYCTRSYKESIVFPIYDHKKWTLIIIEESHSYLLHMKFSWNILLSRMIPYTNDIIGEYQYGFRRNR